MSAFDVKRHRACSLLLEPPGAEAVGVCCDEIERLRAELAARDWQPIETYVYPGKGHRVIVFAHVKSWINNKEVTSARVGEAEFEGYAPGEWAWANASCECCYGSMQGHPTHWMPLPKEPKP